MPFQSQAQWRWAFATNQSFAREWAKMTPGGKRAFLMLAKRVGTKAAMDSYAVAHKHLPGKHDQSSHGHRGAVGGAFRAAYTAARAEGKPHNEAWNAGKHAAEGVREQMRVEKRTAATTNGKIQSNYSKQELQDAIAHNKNRIISLQQQRADLQKKLKEEQEIIAHGGKIPKKLYSTEETLQGVEADLQRSQQSLHEWQQLKPKKEESPQSAEANPLRSGERDTWGSELASQMVSLNKQRVDSQQELPKNRNTQKYQRIQMENQRNNARFSRQAEDLFIAEHAKRNPELINNPEYRAQVDRVRALQQQREENYNKAIS